MVRQDIIVGGSSPGGQLRNRTEYPDLENGLCMLVIGWCASADHLGVGVPARRAFEW